MRIFYSVPPVNVRSVGRKLDAYCERKLTEVAFTNGDLLALALLAALVIVTLHL